jgi:nucleoside-diphosphate-sugar epimerase
MNSLVIGTSQLSHYFPKDFEKISSRNINLKLYKDSFYDRVFLTFAEQRIHTIKELTAYADINTTLILELVEFFKNKANYLIVYGSCELWNNYIGAIDIKDKFDYDERSPYAAYCLSKHLMADDIHESKVKNVFVLHPFNFNSPYRKPDFLFSKIFDSIINKKKIEIGDTYFYRDLIHPKYLVERSLLAMSDEIVGSGRLTFINDFIRELYKKSKLSYEDYVVENTIHNVATKKILYLKSKEIKYSYNDLLKDTLNDIKIWKK